MVCLAASRFNSDAEDAAYSVWGITIRTEPNLFRDLLQAVVLQRLVRYFLETKTLQYSSSVFQIKRGYKLSFELMDVFEVCYKVLYLCCTYVFSTYGDLRTAAATPFCADQGRRK